MKKWNYLSIAMVAIQLVYPICLLIAVLLGMNFSLYNQRVYEIAVTVLFFAMGVWRIIKKTPAVGWDFLLIPAVALSGALLVVRGSMVSIWIMVVNLIGAGIMTFRRKGWGRIVMIVVMIPAAYLLTCWGIIGHVFDGWAAGELIYQVDSPSGIYTAQVLDKSFLHKRIDVEVVKTARYSVLFGAFHHKPQYLRIGIIEDSETLHIFWVDEDTLSINGKLFEIGQEIRLFSHPTAK